MALFDRTFSRKTELEKSYDSIAQEYTRRMQYELYSKPAVKQMLDDYAAAIAESGPCCDIGCGPGHITNYLRQQGVDASGLDQSGKMLKQARKLYPGIKFQLGDLRRLDYDDHQFASLLALYSLSHVAPKELTQALLELRRVVEPGGALLLGFFAGTFSQEVKHWWGQDVDLTFHCYRMLDMVVHLEQTGFKHITNFVRAPASNESFRVQQAFIIAEAVPGIPKARRRSMRMASL